MANLKKALTLLFVLVSVVEYSNAQEIILSKYKFGEGLLFSGKTYRKTENNVEDMTCAWCCKDSKSALVICEECNCYLHAQYVKNGEENCFKKFHSHILS
jgi:hypothetical protein